MIEMIVGAVVALCGSGFVQFLITRHDKQVEKKEEDPINAKLDKIIAEQKKTEKDQLRTQLLVMMSLMPDNKEEIMQLAQRYFGQLKGDWFYSSLFAKWLKDNNIEKPIWFES